MDYLAVIGVVLLVKVLDVAVWVSEIQRLMEVAEASSVDVGVVIPSVYSVVLNQSFAILANPVLLRVVVVPANTLRKVEV